MLRSKEFILKSILMFIFIITQMTYGLIAFEFKTITIQGYV